MKDERPNSLKVFAPAKINLYLHVTGQRKNGYHTLDSLIAFADIGDCITLTPAPDLSLKINGPFARAFKGRDVSAAPDSTNLVVKAARALARLAGKTPGFEITLEKNLPLGAGIGGGSSDGAAVIWAMLEQWKLPHDLEGLETLMVSLGADIPVCFACEAKQVGGIGDVLRPAPVMPEIPIVLVHPGKACITQEVFGRFEGQFGEPVALPQNIDNAEALVEILGRTKNMLQKAAMSSVPDIHNILHSLEGHNDCMLARMSGSGSACFGLFANHSAAQNAAAALRKQNPDWWVKHGWLNSPARY